MVRTKWYWTKWCGQNGTDNMARIKADSSPATRQKYNMVLPSPSPNYKSFRTHNVLVPVYFYIPGIAICFVFTMQISELVFVFILLRNGPESLV